LHAHITAVACPQGISAPLGHLFLAVEGFFVGEGFFVLGGALQQKSGAHASPELPEHDMLPCHLQQLLQITMLTLTMGHTFHSEQWVDSMQRLPTVTVLTYPRTCLEL